MYWSVKPTHVVPEGIVSCIDDGWWIWQAQIPLRSVVGLVQDAKLEQSLKSYSTDVVDKESSRCRYVELFERSDVFLTSC